MRCRSLTAVQLCAASDPDPLPYLDNAFNRAHGAVDMTLEAWLQTAAMRHAGLGAVLLSQSNLTDAYLDLGADARAPHQQRLQPAARRHARQRHDLRRPSRQGASLMELSGGGKQPIVLRNGEQRTFLQDGDTVTLRAHCGGAGAVRIGFGEVAGTIG